MMAEQQEQAETPEPETAEPGAAVKAAGDAAEAEAGRRKRSWYLAGTPEENPDYQKIRREAIEALQSGAPFFALTLDRETGEPTFRMAYLAPAVLTGLLAEEAGRWRRWMARMETAQAVEQDRDGMLERTVEAMIRTHEIMDAKQKARRQAILRGEGPDQDRKETEDGEDTEGGPIMPVVAEQE